MPKLRELSEREQEILSSVKERFGPSKGNRRKLTPKDLKKSMALPDSYVAARVFSVLGGRGQTTASRDDVVAKIASVLMGDDTTKLQFVFDLHDANGDGFISQDEMKKMVEASLRQNEISVSPQEKSALLKALYKKAFDGEPLPRGRASGRIDFTHFKKILQGSTEIKKSMVASVVDWFEDKRYASESGSEDVGKKPGRSFVSLVLFLFTTVPTVFYRFLLVAGYIGLNAFLAYDAFVHYAQSGANLYVQIARACGAILNLNGALILLPMMRSFLGWLRRLPFARLVPIDEHIEIHRIFGTVLFFVGIVHTGAHLLNYSTLTRPFEQSLFQTVAGLTGVIALGALFIMWLFAQNFFRRKGHFELFFFSHVLYVIWFGSMLLHAPNFWKWSVVPLAAYLIEFIYQRAKKRHLSFVSKAKVLPGGVTELQLHRPQGFEFQPGDYLYLRLPKVSRFEWHPFTISSNPEEKDSLSVHIRSLGNWTKAVRRLFDEKLKGEDRRIPAGISGPYGTPSNRIFKAKHAILIGAGIGVTPFASIMRSILYRSLAGESMKLEKVHFFWLNRGQKSFDWFGDLLSEIEDKSKKGFFDVNIYMTNADVSASSGLARIGMELIRKETARDLTTGLKSVTHFGRPDWNKVFAAIAKKRGFGSTAVFFCGPHSLALSVRSAARRFGFSFRKENF